MTTTNMPSLADMVASAHYNLERAHDGLNAFIADIAMIQSDTQWQRWQGKHYTRFEDFFNAEFKPQLQYGYNRFRQLVRSLPILDAVEAETGYRPSSALLQTMQASGKRSPDDIIPLIQAAQEEGKLVKKVPLATVVRAKLRTERTIQDTGTISLSGDSISLEGELSLPTLATIEDAIEATKRQNQHRAEADKRIVIEGIGHGTVLTDDGKHVSINGCRVKVIILEAQA